MRQMKVYLFAMLFLPALLPAHAAGQQLKRSKAPAHKAIFQVSDSDPQKWYLTLSNVKNVQKDLGKGKVQIEVLVYGPGLDMVTLETEVAEKLEEAMDNGVKIVACENTMIGRKLSRSDMFPGIGYVKTGVVELMKRQREGWSYVRP